MKTTELYLKVLNDVRFNVLANVGSIEDYAKGSNGYQLLCKVNEACNLLSDLITIMKFESKVSE